MNDRPDASWVCREPSLQHHVPAADNRQWHDAKAGIQGKEKRACLELDDPAIDTSRSFRKQNQRQSVGRESSGPGENLRAIRLAAIDQHVTGAPQVPADYRELAERLLGDDPQLVRQ